MLRTVREVALLVEVWKKTEESTLRQLKHNCERSRSLAAHAAVQRGGRTGEQERGEQDDTLKRLKKKKMQKRGDREYRSNHRPRRPEREPGHRAAEPGTDGETGARAAAAQGGRCRQRAPFHGEQRYGAPRGQRSCGAALRGIPALRSPAPPRGTYQPHAPGQHQQPGHRHAGTETLRGDEIEKTFSHSGPHRHRHRARPPGPLPARG